MKEDPKPEVRNPKPKPAPQLEQLLSSLVRAIDALAEVIKNGQSSRSCSHLATKQDLAQMENRIMANQAQISEQLRAATAEAKATKVILVKIGGETGKCLEKITSVEAKVVELQAIIDSGAGGEVTTELKDAVDEVAASVSESKAQAQATDDLVPDPAEVPPPVEPPTVAQ